jgi:hypothetical protein
MSAKRLRLALRVVSLVALASAGFIPSAPTYAVPVLIALLIVVRLLSNVIDRKETRP